jgi:hypothetical protein
MRPKTGESETNVSPNETKRFASLLVSHLNHYGTRISHFAVLFVFNGLAAVSFRRVSKLSYRPPEWRCERTAKRSRFLHAICVQSRTLPKLIQNF